MQSLKPTNSIGRLLGVYHIMVLQILVYMVVSAVVGICDSIGYWYYLMLLISGLFVLIVGMLVLDWRRDWTILFWYWLMGTKIIV